MINGSLYRLGLTCFYYLYLPPKPFIDTIFRLHKEASFRLARTPFASHKTMVLGLFDNLAVLL